MQLSDLREPLDATTLTVVATDSAQVVELTVLVDAIPPEYREDVLLAALWLGANTAFQESYIVASLRAQLSDCLMEHTGTVHDFRTMPQLDYSMIERQLSPFARAECLEEISLAICRLLRFLVDVL